MTARHRRITDPSQHDALTSARRHYVFRAGVRKYWKRWTNRRERRDSFRDLTRETVADSEEILRGLE